MKLYLNKDGNFQQEKYELHFHLNGGIFDIGIDIKTGKGIIENYLYDNEVLCNLISLFNFKIQLENFRFKHKMIHENFALYIDGHVGDAFFSLSIDFESEERYNQFVKEYEFQKTMNILRN